MFASSRAHSHLRAVASVLLLVWLTGCMTWSTMKLHEPLGSSLAVKPRDRIRVTTLREGAFELREPYVRGDSLYGYAPGSPNDTLVRLRRVGLDSLIAIPVEEVVQVEVRTVNSGLTALALVGAVGMIVAIAGAADDDQPAQCTPHRSPNACPSCPLVYSWTEGGWRLDSGTFGGAIFPTLQRTDVDNLEFARAEGGVLRLKLANELPETEHVDALSVLAVDHRPGVTVAPDGRGRLHTIRSFTPPRTAVDDDDRDVLRRVLLADGRSWQSARRPRDPANPADLRDGVELVFTRPPAARVARLIVDANNTPWAAFLMQEYVRRHGTATSVWYDSLSSDPARAARLGRKFAREAFLQVLVWTQGEWKPAGVIWEAGPEIRKRQALALDLSGLTGSAVRVRLESIPAFWSIDRVAIDFTPAPGAPELRVRELPLATALDRRGVDVRPLLAAEDGREYVMQTGDFAELRVRVPPVPDGRARTYLLKSTGWYRIHSPEVGEPQVALLSRVENEPGGVAKVAVELLNERRLASAESESAPSPADGRSGRRP